MKHKTCHRLISECPNYNSPVLVYNFYLNALYNTNKLEKLDQNISLLEIKVFN